MDDQFRGARYLRSGMPRTMGVYLPKALKWTVRSLQKVNALAESQRAAAFLFTRDCGIYLGPISNRGMVRGEGRKRWIEEGCQPCVGGVEEWEGETYDGI